MDLRPNLFLIGVQKSATTSIYNWIAQHPEVCGPASMKDTPFFIDDQLFRKGQQFLNGVYGRNYQGQKIIINGSAHNIYFEEALARIKEYNPDARLILVLRNPVDRAISAYFFARKRNLEKDDLITAVEKENDRIHSTDLKIRSETTYVDHGMYFKQISTLYQYYPPERVLILFYEDIRQKQETVIREVYRFIDVDESFTPEFKSLNRTGETRFPWIKNAIYNDSGIKRFMLKNVFDKIVPYDLKYRIKIYFLNLITREGSRKNANKVDPEAREFLRNHFIEDIENLERLLKRDLSNWKK